jgi:hypothetical protein
VKIAVPFITALEQRAELVAAAEALGIEGSDADS